MRFFRKSDSISRSAIHSDAGMAHLLAYEACKELGWF
jgi:hypothetical protein